MYVGISSPQVKFNCHHCAIAAGACRVINADFHGRASFLLIDCHNLESLITFLLRASSLSTRSCYYNKRGSHHLD